MLRILKFLGKHYCGHITLKCPEWLYSGGDNSQIRATVAKIVRLCIMIA